MLALILSLSLSACAGGKAIDTTPYDIASQTPQRFSICHGYGCGLRSFASFSDKEWTAIQAVFNPPPTSAAEERNKIAQAIALMEEKTGEKIGTSKDAAGAGIVAYDVHQMDCIDETINSSLYLSLLERVGLWQFHETAGTARRGQFIDGAWPHNTAVIREKETGTKYAVDSWFHKNGVRPEIIVLETWLEGWRPDTESGSIAP